MDPYQLKRSGDSLLFLKAEKNSSQAVINLLIPSFLPSPPASLMLIFLEVLKASPTPVLALVVDVSLAVEGNRSTTL